MQRRLDVEQPRSFRPVKFVRAHGNEVGIELRDVRERLLAEPLHGVRVKDDSAFTADCAQLGDGLQRANFIVRRHDGHERGVLADGALQSVRCHAALAIHRQARDGETLFFFEVIKAMQHGVMFHGGSDEMLAFVRQHPRRAEDGQVVCLRASAGEDDFTGLCAEKFCRAVTHLVERGASALSHVMHA